MRTQHSLLTIALLILSIIIQAFASDLSSIGREHVKRADAEQRGAKSTVFNDIEVPPMIELSGKTFTSDIAKGYWLVEGFSPYCHHCASLAPKFQKIYEFYYTLDPIPASPKPLDRTSSLSIFTRYYDFRFAKLDCVAFGSTCSDIGVVQYPTIILFRDGEEIAQIKGDSSIKSLSKFIETELEKIRPGSRPSEGPVLPDVKATRAKKQPLPKIVNLPDEFTGEALKDEIPGKDSVVTGPSRSAERGSQMGVVQGKIPNQNGESQELTLETFHQFVSKTENPWFIKFYAPWCQHCQHMAPSWKSMAKNMKGQLNVGEVNCEVERKLCRQVNVDAYPTIIYMQGPEQILYEGGRGLADFTSFAEKAVESSAGLQDVTAKQFEELEKTEDVLFLYLYNHAMTAEDNLALERLPLYLIGHAKLLKSSDIDLAQRFNVYTWPRLLVVRSGRATQYESVSPQSIRDVVEIVHWMKSVWLPLVPELTAGNAQEIMEGTFVVLGILSRKRSDEFGSTKREIRTAALEWMDRQDAALRLERQELREAKQILVDEAKDKDDTQALRSAKSIRINMNDFKRKDARFAWVDGVYWEDWIRHSFGISVDTDGEKIIIFDYDNRRYWDQSAKDTPIAPTHGTILETLPKIMSSPSKLSPKPIGSVFVYYLYHLQKGMRAHIWISVFTILGTFAAIFICLRKRQKSRRTNSRVIFKGDGRESAIGLLGLSSVQTNGKFD